MTAKVNAKEFNALQIRLIITLALDIKSRLEKMGLGEDRELIESLLFDISVIIDGSREMKFNGKQIKPILMFAEDKEYKQLITSGGGSWMHEICGKVVSKMFEKADETGE
ncbi:MAG TPA: hypothetical protein VGH42_02705 [Verrucomicrobiae bacterium]|jgi:hypothetical protein